MDNGTVFLKILIHIFAMRFTCCCCCCFLLVFVFVFQFDLSSIESFYTEQNINGS